MLIPLPLTLMCLGTLILVSQHFVWNFSVLAVGIGASILALLSLFLDPSLAIFF